MCLSLLCCDTQFETVTLLLFWSIVWPRPLQVLPFFFTTWKLLTAVTQILSHSQTTYMSFTRSPSSSLHYSTGLLVGCSTHGGMLNQCHVVTKPAQFLQGNDHLSATFKPAFSISLFYFLVFLYFVFLLHVFLSLVSLFPLDNSIVLFLYLGWASHAVFLRFFFSFVRLLWNDLWLVVCLQAVLSPRRRQWARFFHQRVFQREVLSVTVWVLQLPLEGFSIRISGNSGLSVGVSVVGCLSVRVALNLQLVLDLPRLDPEAAGMDSTTPATASAVMENGWMVLLLFVLSFPRIPFHAHFTNIVEFAALRCQFAVVSFSWF